MDETPQGGCAGWEERWLRVRSLPSRSSQSRCVHVQVVYPQLDCKLLEGSYHFTHSGPSPTMGVGFLKTPGEEKSGLRNLGPYWGKNRVKGMKSRVNLWKLHIFTLMERKTTSTAYSKHRVAMTLQLSMCPSINNTNLQFIFIYHPSLALSPPLHRYNNMLVHPFVFIARRNTLAKSHLLWYVSPCKGSVPFGVFTHLSY